MSSRHSHRNRRHRDDITSPKRAPGSQRTEIPSNKGKHRSNRENEEKAASSVPCSTPLDTIQYPQTAPDSQSYSYTPAFSLPDIGGLNIGHEQQTWPRATDQAQSPIHPLCIVQCTRGWAIPNPAPRPQPTAPRKGDKQDYASYHKDLSRWEAEYETWHHFTCECRNAYYCKAHGQWVSGAHVRKGKAPPQRDQNPDSCHKLGYFCDAHKQWVSDEDVETGKSSSRKSQSSKTCHKDGYFCKAHGRWVPGDMIRLEAAPPQNQETSDRCHLFAEEQTIPEYAPPPDESCKSGNGKILKQIDRPQTYLSTLSSVGYGSVQGPASSHLTSTGYAPTPSSSLTYTSLAGTTSTLSYAEQSPYTIPLVSGPSRYQVYASAPSDTGNEQYPAMQIADAGAGASMGTSVSHESTFTARSPPGYNITNSTQPYDTDTKTNDSYYSATYPVQPTGPYYPVTYTNTAGQQPGTGYLDVSYSSYSSYSNPVDYVQPPVDDQPAAADYDTTHQEESRRATRQPTDRYESNSQASKQGKRRERR